MDWLRITDAVLAALMAAGVVAIVKLGRQVADLAATLRAVNERLTDHQAVHATLDARVSQLERINMERAR